MAALANALPQNTGDGYVAAAYIVFFVLLLVYLAIMALRLGHVQRDLRDLQARAEESTREGETRQGTGAGAATDAAADPLQMQDDQTREREPA